MANLAKVSLTLVPLWSQPPCDFPYLLEDEVHVWLAPFDVGSFLPLLRMCLSPEEIARAARFRSPADERSALVSRGILRQLLGQYLRREPSAIAFACNAFGKPRLAEAHDADGLSFNVSHSQDRVVFAFARQGRIGIDVERIRPEAANEDLVDHYLAPAEVNRLRSLPAAERIEGFFECWTRKEAFLKARGDGLMGRLDTFEVAFGRNVTPAILHVEEDDGTEAQDWTVLNLPMGDDYAAALVAEGPCRQLRCYRWGPVERSYPGSEPLIAAIGG
jgi:4'-phosphopantetheinyl transferase